MGASQTRLFESTPFTPFFHPSFPFVNCFLFVPLQSLTFRNSDPVVAAEWLKVLQDYMNTVTIPAEGYISTKTVFISDVNVNNEKLERVQA